MRRKAVFLQFIHFLFIYCSINILRNRLKYLLAVMHNTAPLETGQEALNLKTKRNVKYMIWCFDFCHGSSSSSCFVS